MNLILPLIQIHFMAFFAFILMPLSELRIEDLCTRFHFNHYRAIFMKHRQNDHLCELFIIFMQQFMQKMARYLQINRK